MRTSFHSACLGALVIGAAGLSASATTPIELHALPPVSLQAQTLSEEKVALESLREDVARHPGDFLTFETRTSANRFIAEHEGAFHETEIRVVSRGVIGYWQGKTLVVLPSLSISATN